MDPERMTYKAAGVDIDAASTTKQRMAASVDSGDPRVLNKLGAFASLVEGTFTGVDDPVLVLKMEEPGSKQLLALEHGRIESLAQDLINHLIDDIAVMGAEPVAVLDTIVCGKLEPDVVVRLVDAMAKACKEQGCALVGGETSEQPGVLLAGRYVLSAAVLGVVGRARIIDGQRISPGCELLAIASNGLHTNGYSMVRKLCEQNPRLCETRVEDESFLDHVLRPHTAYLRGLRQLFGRDELVGLAHITGGGIEGNLGRIVPDGLCAEVDLASVRVLPIFRAIRQAAGLDDEEMLRTFNLGVGMVAVVAEGFLPEARKTLTRAGYDCYAVGRVVEGPVRIAFTGRIGW